MAPTGRATNGLVEVEASHRTELCSDGDELRLALTLRALSKDEVVKTLPIVGYHLWLVDVSHSMEGEPLEDLKSQLGAWLDGMNNARAAATKVAIVSFSNTPNLILGWRKVSDAAPRKHFTFDKFELNGGTYIEKALDLCIDLIDELPENAPVTLHFMSDGLPSSKKDHRLSREKMAALVEEREVNIELHSFFHSGTEGDEYMRLILDQVPGAKRTMGSIIDLTAMEARVLHAFETKTRLRLVIPESLQGAVSFTKSTKAKKKFHRRASNELQFVASRIPFEGEVTLPPIVIQMKPQERSVKDLELVRIVVENVTSVGVFSCELPVCAALVPIPGIGSVDPPEVHSSEVFEGAVAKGETICEKIIERLHDEDSVGMRRKDWNKVRQALHQMRTDLFQQEHTSSAAFVSATLIDSVLAILRDDTRKVEWSRELIGAIECMIDEVLTKEIALELVRAQGSDATLDEYQDNELVPFHAFRANHLSSEDLSNRRRSLLQANRSQAAMQGVLQAARRKWRKQDNGRPPRDLSEDELYNLWKVVIKSVTENQRLIRRMADYEPEEDDDDPNALDFSAAGPAVDSDGDGDEGTQSTSGHRSLSKRMSGMLSRRLSRQAARLRGA